MKMDAIRNLRDVGGYKTAGSKSVAFGKVYRSATLYNATERDIHHLLEIAGIRHVIDFRNENETMIEPQPKKLVENIHLHWLPVLVEGTSRSDIVKHLQQDHPENQDFSSLLIKVNQCLVLDHQAEFSEFFQILLNNEPPFLFHCTEGKDRTGFASALLLSVLGVQREDIFNDYMLTNILNAESIEERIQNSRLLSSMEVNIEQLKRLLMAHRGYLEAAFTTIETKFGSVDQYLESAIGLSIDDIIQLREKFLQ